MAQGTHPRVVQDRMGHSTSAITLDIYSHVLPAMRDEAAATVEVLYSSLRSSEDEPAQLSADE